MNETINRTLLLSTALSFLVCVFNSVAQDKTADMPSHTPLLASQSSPPTTTDTLGSKDAGPPQLERRNPRYQVQDGDILELTFPYTPEFNQTVSVQPDGYIMPRAVGALHVEGQTEPELTHTLEAAYDKIMNEPVITVDVLDFRKPYFTVFGEVGQPGKYDLRGDMTVAEAIATAGGFNDNARQSQVLLFRRVSDDWVEAKKVDLKRLIQAENLREDVHLRPGDMLFVPKNTLAKIKRVIPTQSLGIYINPTQF